MGSLKGPCTTSYRSSIDTIALNRFVFEKIALFCILSTDRQTDRLTNKQTNKQVYRRRYESRRSSKPKLHEENKKKCGEKRFLIWRITFLHAACGTIMTVLLPGDCTLQCGMWLWDHDSEFTKWQHPAMWYVALGWYAVDFARWQHPAIWHVALGSWHWIRQVAAPCNMAGGSGMIRYGISPNVRHIGILHLVSILTISPQSTCHSAPVCEIFIQIGPPSTEKNVMLFFKMADLNHLGF